MVFVVLGSGVANADPLATASPVAPDLAVYRNLLVHNNWYYGPGGTYKVQDQESGDHKQMVCSAMHRKPSEFANTIYSGPLGGVDVRVVRHFDSNGDLMEWTYNAARTSMKRPVDHHRWQLVGYNASVVLLIDTRVAGRLLMTKWSDGTLTSAFVDDVNLPGHVRYSNENPAGPARYETFDSPNPCSFS